MDYDRLTYREIAARLAITPDAARMKAKREAKAGRWRIIPGNHPNDPVHVDVPLGTLPEDPPERAAAPVPAPMPNGSSEWAGFARALQARVEHLTDQLLVEKDAHSRTLSELAAAETRELGTKTELETAMAEVRTLRTRLHRRRWWRQE